MIMDLPPVNAIQQAVPALNAAVAERAEAVLDCGIAGADPRQLIIFDASKRASDDRFFVLDLRDRRNPRLILESKVAHGRGSDPRGLGIIQRFSNAASSGATSLGLYRVAERYIGKHGASYRLDGLTPGFNDNARARAVVMHPARYVGDANAGRSLGCPAVPHAVMDQLARHGLQDTYLLIDDGSDQLARPFTCSASKGVQKDTRPANGLPDTQMMCKPQFSFALGTGIEQACHRA